MSAGRVVDSFMSFIVVAIFAPILLFLAWSVLHFIFGHDDRENQDSWCSIKAVGAFGSPVGNGEYCTTTFWQRWTPEPSSDKPPSTIRHCKLEGSTRTGRIQKGSRRDVCTVVMSNEEFVALRRFYGLSSR